jgi:hypothetical protein
MSRNPVLLGDRSDTFAILVGEGPHAGVVVCVTPSMIGSPVGFALADRLVTGGRTVIVIDEPGHGESVDDVEVEQALALACATVTESGAEVVALVVYAGLLDAALRFSESRDDVVGVASVSVPMPDPMAKLAVSLGMSDLVRRGMRGSTLRKLLDSEARARFFRLIRAKLRRSRGSTHGSASDSQYVSGLRSALAAGKRVLLVAGSWDRGSKAITNLAADSPPDERLETDCSFRGHVSGFATTAAQSWFIDRVNVWVLDMDGRSV